MRPALFFVLLALVAPALAAGSFAPAPAVAGLALSLDLGRDAPATVAAAPAVVDLERLDALDTPFLVDEDGDRMVGDLRLDEGAGLRIATGDLACALCIHAADLALGAVGTAQLAPAAVTTDRLADGAVVAAKLTDGAVVAAKLADGAVLGSKLADGAVGPRALAAGSVTLDKLAPGVLRPVILLGGHSPAVVAFHQRTLHPLSTDRAPDDADSAGKSLVMRRDGTLADLALVVEHNGLRPGEAMTFTVRVNGQDTALRLTVGSEATAAATWEDGDSVPVHRGDRVTVHANTGVPDGRIMGFGWTLELRTA